MKELILASASPYRKALLEKLQLPFRACPANVDETPYSREAIEDYVSRLALSKAKALVGRYPGALIVGSDQACALQGLILGKPGSHEAAVKQLKLCRGQCLRFYTGLVLYDAAAGSYQSAVETYDVKFRRLEDEEIEAYLERDRPYDCAGSFKAEGLGITLFEAMSGTDFNTLIGLPLIRLVDMLIKAGLNPLLVRP